MDELFALLIPLGCGCVLPILVPNLGNMAYHSQGNE